MPSWKKVITSGSDAILNQITASGGIDTPDITIDDWGSVSASLASIDSGANNLTLQDVTDNGNITTNEIRSPRFYSNYGFTITGSSTLTGFQNVNGARGTLYDYGLNFTLDHTNGSVSNTNKIAFESANSATGSFTLQHRFIPGAGGGGFFDLTHTPGQGNPYISDSSYVAFSWEDFYANILHPRMLNIGAGAAGLTMHDTSSVYNAPTVAVGADWLTARQISGSDVYIDEWGSVSASLSTIESDITDISGGVITPIQLVVDTKNLSDGNVAWYGISDLQTNANRAYTTWIAPANGYLDEVVVSPEQTNSTTDDVTLSFMKNAGNQGSVTVAMGAAGTNKTFTFGSGTYSFVKGDRVGLLFGKNTNTADLYNVMVTFRLSN